eukprot:14318685-Heterocapsa_arctica.AAC.1
MQQGDEHLGVKSVALGASPSISVPYPAQTHDVTGVGVGDGCQVLRGRRARPFVGVEAEHGEHDDGAADVLCADLHEATLP